MRYDHANPEHRIRALNSTAMLVFAFWAFCAFVVVLGVWLYIRP